MDFVASTLGLPLPILSARQAVQTTLAFASTSTTPVPTTTTTTTTRSGTPVPPWRGLVFSHRDSLLIIGADCRRIQKSNSIDDDTAAMSDDESSTSSSSSSHSVSFAEPLVTHIHFRPMTTWSEKSLLYYNEFDYREFRMEYLGLAPSRLRLVRFADTVVSHVWSYPLPDDKSLLYYSESELQTFLDEFVKSLQEGFQKRN